MRRCLPYKFILLGFILMLASCNKSNGKDQPTGNDTSVTSPVVIDLFTKYAGNPVFDIGNSVPSWRSIHAANVSVLSPAETGDSIWRLFMRGSGNGADGYHDNIGTLQQPAAGFSPYGPWTEQVNNPNLSHGYAGSYDAQNVLDAVAVTDDKGGVFLYYMSRDASNRSALCVASSSDTGKTFAKYTGNPLKEDVGPNDAIYANGNYYLYYGDAKWNGSSFDEPLQIWLSVSSSATGFDASPRYALKVGGYGSWDSYSVNGAKLFKVSGDNRWFMLYQCSTHNFDYPERFHCAWSTDLVNWTKVSNSRPLLSRGSVGAFDQGAIWTGSVIENGGSLYIYYEGWGSRNADVGTRDQPYYPGGNSRVGVASCTVAQFLDWVKG